MPAYRPTSACDLLTFRMGFGIVMAPAGPYPIQRAMNEHLLGQVPPALDEWIRGPDE